MAEHVPPTEAELEKWWYECPLDRCRRLIDEVKRLREENEMLRKRIHRLEGNIY